MKPAACCVLCIAFAAALGCRRSVATTAATDASSNDASNDAGHASSLSPVIVTPATTEVAHVYAAPPAPKPVQMPVYKMGDIVVLEGIYMPPEEEHDDEKDKTMCDEAIRLSFRIHVKDGAKEFNVGGTKRVCILSWADEWNHRPQPPPMLQRNSRVAVRASLVLPMRPQHPHAVLLLDTEIVSAGPVPIIAPPNVLPDGQCFAYVRHVDVATRAVSLDLAFLYYGEEARLAAEAHGTILPKMQNWFVVNDSPQLRTVSLPNDMSVMQLENNENGGGWRNVPLEKLASADAGSDAGSDQSWPVFVTIKNGAIVSWRGNASAGSLSVVNLIE